MEAIHSSLPRQTVCTDFPFTAFLIDSQLESIIIDVAKIETIIARNTVL